MRSPEPWLVGLVLALAGGSLWTAFHRSGIPSNLDGRVARIEVRPEKHVGVDDVHLVTIGEREIHLDAAVAGRLQRGDVLRKGAWSRGLETPRGEIALEPSADVEGMLLALPLLLLLSLALLAGGRGRKPRGRVGFGAE